MALVTEIIARVARELIDKNFTRWTEETHLTNLNDAISAILIVRPDLGRTTKTDTVSAGVSKVTLPATAYKLLGVNCLNNYALQFVDIYRLNNNYPDWRTRTAAQPLNWTRNDNDEFVFYVYPAPTADATIEYDYAEQIRVEATTDPFPLSPIYELMVFDYMMYRAYSKDGQNESEAAKASAHFQAFQLALTGKTQTDKNESARIKASEAVR
ncbi:hypothetical protein DI392_00710 [Vibrio albus]|uniref:Uncharacterized protein n=1 Tax=Vibrio albus TaxID=2200953 RepID=A0A2U3BDJ1_9VIBR|nr:DUF6682 family protein [Vibrio albus]PWI34835.1 hypothetical protein DI392_00710 [Vibrio albus]